MTFHEELEALTKSMIEVADVDHLNIEWYRNLDEWKNCIWSWVNKRQPYEVKENVLAMKASVLELDEVSLRRFRDAGSKPTYHYISLERLMHYLDEGSYTHVFIFGIGELSADKTVALHQWMACKLKG